MALMGDENASIPTPQPYYEKDVWCIWKSSTVKFDYICIESSL